MINAACTNQQNISICNEQDYYKKVHPCYSIVRDATLPGDMGAASADQKHFCNACIPPRNDLEPGEAKACRTLNDTFDYIDLMKNGKAPPNQHSNLWSSKWDKDYVDPNNPDTWPDGKPDTPGRELIHVPGIIFHDIDGREKCVPPPGEDSYCPPSKDLKDPESKELAVVSKSNDSFSSFDELIASDLDSCPTWTAIGCSLAIIGVIGACYVDTHTLYTSGLCMVAVASMGIGCFDCADDSLVAVMCIAADNAQELGAEYPQWLVDKCIDE